MCKKTVCIYEGMRARAQLHTCCFVRMPFTHPASVYFLLRFGFYCIPETKKKQEFGHFPCRFRRLFFDYLFFLQLLNVKR